MTEADQPPSAHQLAPTLNRRTFTFAALMTAFEALLPSSARGQVAVAARNVVLVHGLFADGSSWSAVIPYLQKAGLNVTSVQNPLTTLDEAVAATERVFDRQEGPTVLVGHSFGGTVVTQAGAHPRVSSLVYIAARAPDAGEDYAALAKHFPTPPASAGITFDGDEGRLSEQAFTKDFAGDLPRDHARALFAVQWPFRMSLLSDRTTKAAWRSKPSFYAVSSRDRTIDPTLQCFMAKRMNAHTVELNASHVSPLSRPREVSALIMTASSSSR